MDGESYEDPAVAAVLNRDFVCVKVDRDERPDVDTRYQRAVQALTGQGGWPLTAFLTPEGEVFFGGTYFPPEENHFGRPGFLSVLGRMVQLYRDERDKVAGNAAAIRTHVAQSLDESKAGPLDPDLPGRIADQMARLFDVRYGGFGTAPKFPHPAAVRIPRRPLARHARAVAARDRREDAAGHGAGRCARPPGRWIPPLFGG